MLYSHLRALEEVLLAQSRAAANAGHPNLRGGPREWFVRDFLVEHLPSNLEVGQGEIIDSRSIAGPSPAEYRKQVDVVIYRRDLPKLTYAACNNAFLAEGVMATIEVKSNLTKAELATSAASSKVHKSLERRAPQLALGNSWRPNCILTYLLAYKGPDTCETVGQWIKQAPELDEREQGVDMIVILGRGVVWRRSVFPSLRIHGVSEGAPWAFVDQAGGNLAFLFAHFLQWLGSATTTPDLLGYAESFPLGEASVIL